MIRECRFVSTLINTTMSIFCYQVYFWRGIGAIGVSTLSVPCISLIVNVVINVDVIHPISWLVGENLLKRKWSKFELYNSVVHSTICRIFLGLMTMYVFRRGVGTDYSCCVDIFNSNVRYICIPGWLQATFLCWYSTQIITEVEARIFIELIVCVSGLFCPDG